MPIPRLFLIQCIKILNSLEVFYLFQTISIQTYLTSAVSKLCCTSTTSYTVPIFVRITKPFQ